MAYNSSNPNAGVSGMKPGQQGSVQEFSIRVPKNTKKKFHVMRFNSNLGVDLIKWKSQNMQIKMERENNLKEFKGMEEEMPKFGAGSEFGREQREEARRKKYGYIAKKYKPEDQPWILKQGGKSGKKFKGIREGGVSDNTAYYVFTQAGNGIIEAHPLQEWYKFQPIQRYKALSAEEAEAEFGRRNKIINYFSLMTKKRLRNEEDGDLEDPDEVKGKKGGSKKKDKGDLKISEMDDWIDSDDFSDSDEDAKKSDDDDDGARGKGKKKGNKKKGAPKKKKKGSDDEAVEESDDGDEEGRELDYISDSSESASDHEMKANKELKGVAEEDGLRKLINSESEDEEEQNEEKKDENASNSEDEESKNKKEKEEKEGNEKAKESNKKKKPKKDKKSKKNSKNAAKKNDGESSSELSPNSTDSDSDSYSKNKPSNKTKDTTNSAESSRSATPTPAPAVGEKRKLTQSELAVAATKKAKLESSSSSGANSSHLLNNCESGITEDAVRRYLMRKPMTTTELLQKLKSKKSGMSSQEMVTRLTQILKNINPHIQNIQNKKYLSIRPA